MDCPAITYEDFAREAKKFVDISDRICDGWKLHDIANKPFSLHLKKESFVTTAGSILKAEYVISFSVSYGVPMFAFNLWNSSGVLLSLEEVRETASINISEKEFYSVITQQEHPMLFRPLYTVHPCHTAHLLHTFKEESTNLLVTFISLISPLITFSLPLDYALLR